MKGYENKEALINEIEQTANLFIKEFDTIEEKDKSKMIDGVDRTPAELISYQLGWLNLIRGWDKDESLGKEVVTPARDYKWNNLGELYRSFYRKYEDYSLKELQDLYISKTKDFIQWAASTPSNWPVWKWLHINTVAPFKSFRSKIRKWKKLNKQ